MTSGGLFLSRFLLRILFVSLVVQDRDLAEQGAQRIVKDNRKERDADTPSDDGVKAGHAEFFYECPEIMPEKIIELGDVEGDFIGVKYPLTHATGNKPIATPSEIVSATLSGVMP